MKIFDKRYKAVEEFRQYKPYDGGTISFWTEYNWKDWKMGDWVLIQYIKGGEEISRPIYGLFIDFSVWDMALVVNIVESKRAYTQNYGIGVEDSDGFALAWEDPEVESFELWTGNIRVLGHWKTKPSIKELKLAYKENVI